MYFEFLYIIISYCFCFSTQSLFYTKKACFFTLIISPCNDKINSVVSGNEGNVICVKTMKNFYEIPVSQLKVGSSISTGEKVIAMKADQMIRCWIK